jgi:hypothetical protein
MYPDPYLHLLPLVLQSHKALQLVLASYIGTVPDDGDTLSPARLSTISTGFRFSSEACTQVQETCM